MTQIALVNSRTEREDVIREINAYVNGVYQKLYDLNKKIHDNPETAWEEHLAHDNICNLLEDLGFAVTRHAYGVSTAFEVRTGQGGRLVNFNADGRVQCLGTPAEELGGGKIPLLEAGAFNGVSASLMVHPFSDKDVKDFEPGVIGVAGQTSLAIGDMNATFHGKSSHAAAYPWDGINALDAVVSAYANVSMMRQQLHPDERVHGCITEAPKISNAIPDITKMSYSYRSPTLSSLMRLEKRVKCCLEAGALATGCSVELTTEPTYVDLLLNDTLCESFQSNIACFGHRLAKLMSKPGPGSTDQGNVSHAVPALHAVLGIPCPEGAHPHHQSFTAAAGTTEAFEIPGCRQGNGFDCLGYSV